MEYTYAVLLLDESGKELNETNITAVLKAAGIAVEESRVKALVAALEDVPLGEFGGTDLAVVDDESTADDESATDADGTAVDADGTAGDPADGASAGDGTGESGEDSTDVDSGKDSADGKSGEDSADGDDLIVETPGTDGDPGTDDGADGATGGEDTPPDSTATE